MRIAILYTALTAAGLSLSAVPVLAQTQASADAEAAVVIRQTVPNPRAVHREPLTSDQLSTTSTRLIDARRGFRSYDTVHRHGHGSDCLIAPRYTAYDDHFGVTHAGDRPYSYATRRASTSVATVTNTFTGNNDAAQRVESPTPARPIVVVIRDERPNDGSAAAERPGPDMRVRIHQGEAELPTRSGAVLIMADGTVISVGD